ncbi:thioredoxin-like protein [Gilbertella persicaria]|uniref:Thioredoxin n=1 Tax=Rhizopus stolonifer TaxID=4846 RepID=A0A367JRN7_RHIST|nr:thioredoxin-like protein [Gilbertella persicaria]KAI8055600.1 thioredoxin-like protein [Gilbertella persicaria]RCH92620.1 Cytoplasmic thioredoxin isoenzyme 2 [Rhizopus stolonifer]
MPIIEIGSHETFQKVIQHNKLIVVDFYAVWCGPCKAIAPRMESFAATYSDVVFLKVDVDTLKETAAQYQITAMPTILFFKQGQKLGQVVGANIKEIQDKIEQLR